MNLRSKVVAVAAAGLVSLGLAGGVAFADPTSSPSVTITLNGGVTTCSAVSDSVSLGTYNWVGGKYVYDTTNPGKLSVSVTINEAFGESGDTCDVTVYRGVLSAPGGAQLSVPIALTSETVGANFNSPNPMSTDPTTPSTLATGLNNGLYAWDAVPIPSGMLQPLSPGAYTGTLYLSGNVSAP